MLRRDCHVGEHIGLGLVEEAGKLGQLGTELVGDLAPLGASGLGIVLGGSGNGEQIAANTVPGARCALAWSTETAALAREHNNAQLIGIGGRMHTEQEALAIIDTFLTTAWSEAPRHQRRIDILTEYERTHVAPPVPGARD